MYANLTLTMLRILYTLLDAEINAWYQIRIDNNPANSPKYSFETIREMEANLEWMGKEIQRQEEYQKIMADSGC